jgi:hypothetical protein
VVEVSFGVLFVSEASLVSGVSSMGTFLVKGVASSCCFKRSSRSAWRYCSCLMMFWTLGA